MRTLEVAAADVVLGSLAPHELPSVAELALCNGRDSKSLAILAGTSPRDYNRWEIEELWQAILRELRISEPTLEEAARVVVLDAARAALRGDATPKGAVDRIAQGLYYGRTVEVPHEYRDQLVSLHFEYEEVGAGWARSASEIDRDVLKSFSEIVAEASA